MTLSPNPPLTLESLKEALAIFSEMASKKGSRIILGSVINVCHPIPSNVDCARCGQKMLKVVQGNVEYACACGHTYTRRSTLEAIAREAGQI